MTNIQGDRLPAYSFRNRLVNGDMKIDQRNVGAQQIVTTSGAYTVDRWQLLPTGNSVAGKQVAVSSGWNYTISGNTSVTAVLLSQKLEGNNILDILGTTVTLQLKVSSTSLTNVNWNAYYNNNTIDTAWSTANSINFANGFWTINTTSTVYSTAFTVNNSCSNGMQIAFTTGSFASGNLTITDVQLEAGSVPSPYERLPWTTQMALCQRYYAKSYNQSTVPGTSQPSGGGGITVITQIGTVDQGFPLKMPQLMRANPSITTYDNAGTAGRYSYYNAGWQNGGIPSSVTSTGGEYFQLQSNSSVANGIAYSFDFTLSGDL